VAVLAAAAVFNWRLATQAFADWPNARPFISSFKPVAARSQGSIFASAQKRVAAYYTPQGEQWWLWRVDPLSLNPTNVPLKHWYSYYAKALRTAGYGTIALFYQGSDALQVRAAMQVAPADAARISAKLKGLDPMKPSEPGVRVLTRALSFDHEFRLMAIGPYDSATSHGIYAIWLRRPDGSQPN